MFFFIFPLCVIGVYILGRVQGRDANIGIPMKVERLLLNERFYFHSLIGENESDRFYLLHYDTDNTYRVLRCPINHGTYKCGDGQPWIARRSDEGFIALRQGG